MKVYANALTSSKQYFVAFLEYTPSSYEDFGARMMDEPTLIGFLKWVIGISDDYDDEYDDKYNFDTDNLSELINYLKGNFDGDLVVTALAIFDTAGNELFYN